MKKLIFVIFIPLIFSCNTDNKEFNTTDTNTTAANNQNWRPQIKKTLNEAEKVTLTFYETYLKNFYEGDGHETPVVGITTDSTYYLDTLDHIKFLDKLGCFSSEYYKNRTEVYNACRAELKKLNPGELDGPPDGDCAFMTFMIWTGGQGETLNTADILKSSITDSTAKVVVAIGDSIGKYIYSYPTVELIREDNKWKISGIDLSYDRPKD